MQHNPQQIYVIRDTSKHPKNTAVLHAAVEEFVDSRVDCIVRVDARMQTLPKFPHPIINLDPFSRQSDHHPFDICRLFDIDDKVLGYISRNTETLEDQASKIPKGTYVLVDDDISTGKTVQFVISFLAKFGIEIANTFSLAHHTLSEDFGFTNFEIFDIIDTHDFWNSSETSGLNVQGVRKLYTDEQVNLEKRASFTNSKAARQFLIANLQQF